MKKSGPVIPTKPISISKPLLLCGKQVSCYWLGVDWLALINMRKPLLKLTFAKKSNEDWLLYDQTDILAENMHVDFHDAAHWALQRALDDRFVLARDMEAQRQPWDPDILYACRVMSLQICKYHGPKDIHTLEGVDHMIRWLLLTDGELLQMSQSTKRLPR
jgi:hypothetical protein